MKQNKLLSIVMAAVLSLGSLPLTAVQAQETVADFLEEELLKKNETEEFEEVKPEITPQKGDVKAAGKIEEEYSYEELEDGTLEITGYNGNDAELVVPAKINGKRVTSIGVNTFYGCSNLTSIELPEGVTSIEGSAFSGCSSLKNIKLPASLNNIIEWDEMDEVDFYSIVFSGCSSLTEIMVDENNANYTSQDGILYDKNQTELIRCPEGKTGSIVIPASVASIRYYAFKNCSGLTEIKLPTNLTWIRQSAFRNCSGLTSIELPEKLERIEKAVPGETVSVFSGCSNLTEIMVDENNANYTSQDGILYDKNQTELIRCPEGKTGSIVIPASVTSMDWDAFRDCRSLTSIELPAGLTTTIWIWYAPFRGCSSLTEIMVDGNNPTYMSQDGILYDKNQMELIFCPEGKTGSIAIPANVTSIGDKAFSNCSSLTKIKVPASVTYIDYNAFPGCKNLTLFVYKGSYAENYAKHRGLVYRYITNCSHTFQITTVKATTKKNGSITKTCAECGKQIKETIYAAKTIKLSKTSYIYNRKNQKPSVTVKDSKGKVLKNEKDYTVTYPKAIKNVGSYTVTIKFKGNYIGTVKKTFQIVPKGTQICKITRKKKGFVLKWNKQAVQTTGYEIAYSTNKKFNKKTTGTATIGKNKTVSRTISKLKAGKKYYVRIRTYKTVKLNGKSKKLYSAWSKVKTVTTKK